MALIVETGAGLPDAESWASVADADAYHLARGNAGWTGETATKEAALRRGTDYLEGLYRARWSGRPAAIGQALGWPRAYVCASTGNGYLPSDKIPVALVRACCECALRELESPGSLAPDFVPGEIVTSETVGPLSTDYATAPGSPVDPMPRLVAVDRLLAPLLRSGAAGGLVLRA